MSDERRHETMDPLILSSLADLYGATFKATVEASATAKAADRVEYAKRAASSALADVTRHARLAQGESVESVQREGGDD